MTTKDNEYIWLNFSSQKFLERGYLEEGQTVDERVSIICNRAEQILGEEGFGEKLKNCVKKGWFSFSTPVWTNYGTNRGMAISCFGSTLIDNIESILYTHAEIGMMSKHGGGTSADFTNLRCKGSKINTNGETQGPVHFMGMFDTLVTTISQGSARRGSFAAILSVDHPDIDEFLTIRSEGSPLQDISFGVTIPRGWMESMIDGDAKKRKIWAKILQVRSSTGYPYIQWLDNSNDGAPPVYKDQSDKYFIHQSNLCQEIQLFSGEFESFVCCLSSMNVIYYDEWKNTDAVAIMVRFLDTVISEFIEKASKIKFMDRAVRFAKNHRALGIGQLGFHSYLQSKMIPYESNEAKQLSEDIAKNIKEKAYAESERLGKLLGVPSAFDDCTTDIPRRNTTLIAIAPTKSSAFILGQASESVEPIQSNAFVDDKQKIKHTYRNPYLSKLLKKYDKNNQEVWDSIIKNRGSVRHLHFLSDEEKLVFKTFSEISQYEVILHASIRQKYIDQGQSLNLMIHPQTKTKDVNKLYIEAWKLGIKSLYYSKSISAAQEFTKELIDCEACSV